MVSSPGTSTYLAPGIWPAIHCAASRLIMGSLTRRSTSVGTLMVGSTWRTSVSAFMRRRAAAAPGLADMTS